MPARPTPSPPNWPEETRSVYEGLQSYRIVGASACVTAVMSALQALAGQVVIQPGGDVYWQLAEAGELFAALKPSTAAYLNAVRWLLSGLDDPELDGFEVAAQVVARVERYAAYSRASVARIADQTCRLVPPTGRILVHDYSSTVLAIVAEAGRQGRQLSVFVTAGEPVNQGPKVAAAVNAAGHHLTYLPDSGVGRVMGELDVVLTGVETLFRSGDLANTVGTYPIALLARESGVPLYGVTERMKIHPTADTVSVDELNAQVLHPWPADHLPLPAGTEVRREVLDLTPAGLITGYVTEEGVIAPTAVSGALERLYADLAASA